VSGESELDAAEGFLEAELRDELPGLTLRWLTVDVRPSRSTGELKARLRSLSNRIRGESVVTMRTQPIPRAYRVFFRQIGLDPEVVRTPIEAAVLERMIKGGFLSAGLLEDVRLIALIDTGVPVWALDAGRVDGPLGIRTSAEGERLGRSSDAPSLPAGRLAIADASSPLAILFGELAPGHEPVARTRRLVLFAVQVAGVPELYAEEALWICSSSLQSP
jgi:DNA/RNA-binding domain of Phe-tRNA-synthetase-like protein